MSCLLLYLNVNILDIISYSIHSNLIKDNCTRRINFSSNISISCIYPRLSKWTQFAEKVLFFKRYWCWNEKRIFFVFLRLYRTHWCVPQIIKINLSRCCDFSSSFFATFLLFFFHFFSSRMTHLAIALTSPKTRSMSWKLRIWNLKLVHIVLTWTGNDWLF